MSFLRQAKGDPLAGLGKELWSRSRGRNGFRARHNYEGREFDSRTRLVVGWAGRAAWLGPSSEGGFMRGVSGFSDRSSSGFSWSESAGAGTSSEWAGNDQLRRVRLGESVCCEWESGGLFAVRLLDKLI